MATPTEKSKEIGDFLDIFTVPRTGMSRHDAITQNKCSWCGKDATHFRDALSEKEYTISGMCQDCQDDTFGGPDE